MYAKHTNTFTYFCT